MEFVMENLCSYCAEERCPLQCKSSDNANCVFNLIIYEDDTKVLFYNLSEKRIFKIERYKGIREISFKEAIREIDIIPSKKPDWKRIQILKLAKELGFFGLN